jgi:hypothetical protein
MNQARKTAPWSRACAASGYFRAGQSTPWAPA